MTTHDIPTDDAVYKTLLESTRAIPWKIDWATMQFAYIGPQIEELLGWTPDSWVTVQDWAERMHPEDRQWAVDFCVAQSMAGLDHEADYRALCSNGDYVWIRDVVHVVRNADGTVNSLIGFMFDISERKKTEEKLLVMQRELEELSFKDGLTNVANRRRFDQVMDAAWERARNQREPIALLMIDIDYFKQYNDRYGHLAGDDCLRRVASVLAQAATRPNDLLARIGGEEFAMLLPGTSASGAVGVAEHCRQLLKDAQILHGPAPLGRLTASIGVGAVTPEAGDNWVSLLDRVDRRLYAAKQAGRDRMMDNDPVAV